MRDQRWQAGISYGLQHDRVEHEQQQAGAEMDQHNGHDRVKHEQQQTGDEIDQHNGHDRVKG